MINNEVQKNWLSTGLKVENVVSLVWIQFHGPEQVRPPSSGLKWDVVLISLICFEERLMILSNKSMKTFLRLVNGVN